MGGGLLEKALKGHVGAPQLANAVDTPHTFKISNKKQAPGLE